MRSFVSCDVDGTALRTALKAVLSENDMGIHPGVAAQNAIQSRSVAKLLSAIQSEPFDPSINVQQLKSKCGILDNNVSSRFRREVGISIKGYIDNVRLCVARRLLIQTEASVFNVCQAVGYYHPQTFYRAFYRSFKCTPRQIRDQHD